MSKKMVYILPLLLSFLFLNCNKNTNNPVTPIDSGIKSLSKTVWNTSDILNWPSHGWLDNLYGWQTAANSVYDFTFDNYQYNLTYSQVRNSDYSYTNTVSITVNNTNCASKTWVNYDTNENSRWLGWFSFVYNGTPMQLNIYVSEHYFEMTSVSEPYQIQVKVQETYLDIPTGFSATPTVHNNYNQVVTCSWDVSTDTDVTGYEICRQRWYVDGNGNIQHDPTQLVHTVISRTTSSWQDSPNWGVGGRGSGVGFYYSIRAISSTINMQSDYTPILAAESALQDYYDRLP